MLPTEISEDPGEPGGQQEAGSSLAALPLSSHLEQPDPQCPLMNKQQDKSLRN